MNAFERLEPAPAAVRRSARRHPGQLRILPAQDREDGARPCGSRSRLSSRCSRASSRSPTAPAARPASAPTRRSSESSRKRRSRPAAHLTCVGASRDEVDAVARDYWELGVRHIVALRGDPPEAGTPVPAASRRLRAMPPSWSPASKRSRRSTFRSPPIRKCIRIRRRARSTSTISSARSTPGADRAITQFFFSPDCFFRFRDEAAAAGIDAEIVPGILPVSNVATDAPLRRDAAAPAFPTGSTSCSKGSTTCPRRAS